MIITLILWIVTLFILSMAGWLVVTGLGGLVKQPAASIHPTVVMLAGLALITFIADIASLFLPLNQSFFYVLAAGAVLIAVIRLIKNHRLPHFNPPRFSLAQVLVLVLGCLIFIIVLDLSSRLPANADTAIYHAQAIHWIEEYPAVPGLGNLHSRLAYNSNWLVDNAVFSYTWAGRSAPYHVLPGLLALFSLFYLMEGLWQIAGKNYSPLAIIKALLIPLFFIVSPSEVSSPGTDMPAVFLTWIILCESLDGLLTARPDSPVRQLLVVNLALFSVTVKLSVVPLLILPLVLCLLYLRHKVNRWLILHFAVFGLLILGAWMARNVILSGYLIYPFPQVDLFSFDWKIPASAAGIEINSITNWARHIWVGADQHNNTLPIQEWAPLWFKAETANRKAMACLAGLGLLVYAVLLCFRAARLWLKRMAGESFQTVLGLSFAGCIYWFLSAPDFRFGYSFILFSILMIFLPLIAWALTKKWVAKAFPFLTVIILLLFQFVFYIRSFQALSYTTRLVSPEPYPSSPTSSCKFGNFSTWCADIYNQCWYTPFPCVPRPLDSVEKRTDDLKDGFRDTEPFH